LNFDSEEEKLKFLSSKLEYSINDGKIVGKHQGAHYFTKGQRKGLAVGGTPEPLFVIETDVKQNIIYTGQGKKHPGLFRKALYINNNELHWIRKDLELKIDECMNVMARIRYRQPLQKARIHKVDSGLYIEFEKAQSAITEGQFAAWYIDEELVGSGVIS
jgi:tRNA-specific 2-thiouridylase